MKKKNINKTIVIIISLIIFVGCDRTFEEINTNPNEPNSVSLDILMPTAQAHLFDNYGARWDRYSGVFTQHFAGNHATGVDFDQYVFKSSDQQAGFTEMYHEAFMDLKIIIEQATEKESPHYTGVAKICTALGLGYLTDIYGDIPFSETLQGEVQPFPKYDTQEAIYEEIQKLLSEGIDDLGKTSRITMGNDDIVFQGDLDKWIAMAHVVKARYYNHLSKLDPVGSATSALAEIDAAKAAGLVEGFDMMYQYNGTAQHQNPWFTLYQNNLIIASENFIGMLQTTDDPRLEAFWDTKNVDGDVVGYTGKPNGFGISNVSFSPVGPDGFYGKQGSPVLIATYFEAMFIEAEAAFRSGSNIRAAEAHNNAVSASVNLVVSDANGLARIPAYIAANGSETEATITIEKIMTEKYKAMFAQEIECWVDVRRHDYQYPDYLHIPIKKNGDVVAQEFVRRVLYPQSELDLNSDQVPSGITVFNKLWWDN